VQLFKTILLLAILQGNVVSTGRPATVTGVVVKQGTGEPLAKATVTLSPEAPGPNIQSYTAATSADGKFSFENVAAGRYRLSSTRSGYVRAEYGVRGANGCGSAVVLSEGQRLADAQVTMTPAGAISGRLRDQDGDPASKVTVNALKYSYENGRRVLTVVETAQTNDLGEYRLFGLTPGRYYVGAALPAGNEVIPGLDGAFLTRNVISNRIVRPEPRPAGVEPPAFIPAPNLAQLGYISTGAVPPGGLQFLPAYYPGTPDPQAATAIEVRAGDSFLQADMTVTLSKTRRVRGRILNRGTGEVPRGLAIFLVSRVPDSSAGNALRAVTATPEGSYEIPAVLPGSYFLAASGNDSSGRLSGRVTLDVGSSDLENIDVAVSNGILLAGRISADDAALPGRIESVSLRSLNGVPGIPGDLSAKVADGVFKFEGIPPGDYLATVAFNGPPDIYMKSMKLGSQDVQNGFRLDAPIGSPLEIVLGNKGAVVEGTVVNDKQQPVAGATVVLVPDASLRKRSTAYRVRTTDSSGRFRIDAIATGEYKLLAWEEVEPGAWEDPDFLRTYEARSRTVTLREGTADNVQLTSLPSTAPVYGQCENRFR